jgi:hypothetical protein
MRKWQYTQTGSLLSVPECSILYLERKTGLIHNSFVTCSAGFNCIVFIRSLSNFYNSGSTPPFTGIIRILSGMPHIVSLWGWEVLNFIRITNQLISKRYESCVITSTFHISPFIYIMRFMTFKFYQNCEISWWQNFVI